MGIWFFAGVARLPNSRPLGSGLAIQGHGEGTGEGTLPGGSVLPKVAGAGPTVTILHSISTGTGYED